MAENGAENGKKKVKLLNKSTSSYNTKEGLFKPNTMMEFSERVATALLKAGDHIVKVSKKE